MAAQGDLRNKIVQLTGFGLGNFIQSEAELKPLKANDVRIRVKAAALNYRDLLVAKGLYSKDIPLPLIPLSDAAGEVVATGPEVTRLKVGDRVMPGFMPDWIGGAVTPETAKTALGGFVDGVLSSYFSWNEKGFVKIPAHLSYKEAATLPCAALTAWNALFESCKLRPGDTVLLLGSGGVSTFALQFALMAGAKVICTTGCDQKAKRLEKLGASHVINYKKNLHWGKAALEATGGRGVDHVVEVGGSGTLEQSIHSVRMGGTISLIGVLSGTAGFETTPLLMKNICLQGLFVGSIEMFQRMSRAIEVNSLRPIIDAAYPMHDIEKALAHLESGKHFGKIVIDLES